ncbi:hypothetical protein ABES58_01085 [Paenibacillus lautus]|uniref:hypothetical protein n=1 Tax=Paenibacillus lautus TaxID=1401 RepID=UPI003D2D2797
MAAMPEAMPTTVPVTMLLMKAKVLVRKLLAAAGRSARLPPRAGQFTERLL